MVLNYTFLSTKQKKLIQLYLRDEPINKVTEKDLLDIILKITTDQ